MLLRFKNRKLMPEYDECSPRCVESNIDIYFCLINFYDTTTLRYVGM